MNWAMKATDPDKMMARKAAAALTPKERRLFVKFHFNEAESESLIDWAVGEMVAGRDSPNLRLLAGLCEVDRDEARQLFGKAMADLGNQIPDKRECLIQFCGDTAREVLAGTTPPLTAFESIMRLNMELDYPEIMQCWMQLDYDFDCMGDREGSALDRQEEAIRETCRQFIALLVDYVDEAA